MTGIARAAVKILSNFQSALNPLVASYGGLVSEARLSMLHLSLSLAGPEQMMAVCQRLSANAGITADQFNPMIHFVASF